MAKNEELRLGQLAPRHTFFLNPYRTARFTRCPLCERQMKARKKPFFVHVDPNLPVLLNMTGRYCPPCDLLILHQDQVEELLALAVGNAAPELVGNEYMVMGTVERGYWRRHPRQPGTLQETLANLHDFKEVVVIEPAHYGWYPAEEEE